MHGTAGRRTDPALRILLGLASLAASAGGLAAGGCHVAGSAFEFFGSPYTIFVPTTQPSTVTTTGRQTGTSLQAGTVAFTDPCSEPPARKLVRISMRNRDNIDYIHYFLVLIAYVNGSEYPNGGVCPNDIAQYTAFGYVQVATGQNVPFGNLCIRGPALYYFHRGGQFRTAGGPAGQNLGSAIAPAQGSTPSYDPLFTSVGLTVPIPDRIIFHNPGTAGGQTLKISRNSADPCATTNLTPGDPSCQQDSFYYVDNTDRIAGSTALGSGSGRRVPNDIEGTDCQCLGTTAAAQSLAPSGQSALTAACNQFFRGGRIDYVFVRDDTDPPYPQLLWRVTDAAGARAHDFDPRANIR